MELSCRYVLSRYLLCKIKITVIVVQDFLTEPYLVVLPLLRNFMEKCRNSKNW